MIDMKYFSWNDEKNEQLKRDRNISFEEVVFYIDQGGLLDVIEHPDKTRYGNQRMFIVSIEHYAYLIPFVEDEDGVFLKTIIPSRKATKKYIRAKRQ